MALQARYFVNPYINIPIRELEADVDPHELRGRIKELAQYIRENKVQYKNENNGGLYVGPAGIGYAFYHLAVSPGMQMDETERQDYTKLAMGLVEENAKYYEIPEVSRDERNSLGFLTGAAGVYAVAVAIASSLNSPEGQIKSYINKFSSLAKYFTPVEVH